MPIGNLRFVPAVLAILFGARAAGAVVVPFTYESEVGVVFTLASGEASSSHLDTVALTVEGTFDTDRLLAGFESPYKVKSSAATLSIDPPPTVVTIDPPDRDPFSVEVDPSFRLEFDYQIVTGGGVSARVDPSTLTAEDVTFGEIIIPGGGAFLTVTWNDLTQEIDIFTGSPGSYWDPTADLHFALAPVPDFLGISDFVSSTGNILPAYVDLRGLFESHFGGPVIAGEMPVATFEITGIVPEPGTALLLTLGITALPALARRRARATTPGKGWCAPFADT